MRKSYAIFLDRDGIINRHRDDYVKKLDEFELLPNVPYYLNEFRNMGYKLIIISNQSAINRGLTTIKVVEEIHAYMLKKLQESNCKVDAIYFCPHRPDENCECRKPKIKMLIDAARIHNIDLTNSWMIGDNVTDIEAGNKAGCKTIRIDTNGSLANALAVIGGARKADAI